MTMRMIMMRTMIRIVRRRRNHEEGDGIRKTEEGRMKKEAVRTKQGEGNREKAEGRRRKEE